MTPAVMPSWMRPMRRQNQEIGDEERMWEILRRADVCRIAFCHEGWPYIVPMNFGCLDGKLYFHCASEGTKLDLLDANPNVCFEVDVNVEIVPGADACNWSVRYQSVVGLGRLSIVEESEEKRAGLTALLVQCKALAQYAGSAQAAELSQQTDQGVELPENVSAATVILRIDIESMTGKESTGD